MTIENSEITKYIFSGHDSFHCRQLWLKKGYDFVKLGKNFNDEDSVIQLGVGKNMVSSIRFWLKAFNIIDNKDIPTEFGERLFNNENGYDPFLEDDASLWLLHYQLVKSGYASIYTLVFNEFRKEKLFFKKENFVSYIKRIGESNSEMNLNENTLAKDFSVFINLFKNEPESKDIEDSFSGILSDLELLHKIVKVVEKDTVKGKVKEKEEFFYIENQERDNLPEAVILYAILDNSNYGNSISLNSLEFDWNSPGSIFALNRSGLMNKISGIVSDFNEVTFTDHAGIKELQIKIKTDPYKILDKYYGN